MNEYYKNEIAKYFYLKERDYRKNGYVMARNIKNAYVKGLTFNKEEEMLHYNEFEKRGLVGKIREELKKEKIKADSNVIALYYIEDGEINISSLFTRPEWKYFKPNSISLERFVANYFKLLDDKILNDDAVYENYVSCYGPNKPISEFSDNQLKYRELYFKLKDKKRNRKLGIIELQLKQGIYNIKDLLTKASYNNPPLKQEEIDYALECLKDNIELSSDLKHFYKFFFQGDRKTYQEKGHNLSAITSNENGIRISTIDGRYDGFKYKTIEDKIYNRTLF